MKINNEKNKKSKIYRKWNAIIIINNNNDIRIKLKRERERKKRGKNQ